MPLDLKTYIRDVPDFPKPGILFRDITPLLRDPDALRDTIEQLAAKCEEWSIDAIAGIESRGFVFATALAVRMGLGLIPVRKPGKLPHQTFQQKYELEYGTDAVEVHQDATRDGESVLMVDDLLATGGTMGAACQVIEKCGGRVVGCLFVIELGALGGRERLPDVPTESLIHY